MACVDLNIIILLWLVGVPTATLFLRFLQSTPPKPRKFELENLLADKPKPQLLSLAPLAHVEFIVYRVEA